MSFEEFKESITIDELEDMLRDCITYDGSFDDLDYYENSEYFFEDMFSSKDEVARAVYYGDYNYCDDYVKFNAYGNLESCSEYEYQQEILEQEDDIIEHYLELYSDDNVYPTDELKQKIRDYYEEKDEEQEDE